MNCGDDDPFGFGGGFGSPFGGGGGNLGGGGGGFRREIDEETLLQVADLTGGEDFVETVESRPSRPDDDFTHPLPDWLSIFVHLRKAFIGVIVTVKDQLCTGIV
jgi:hypothetical protein